MTWKETLEKIQAGEETARAQALRRWDSLAKPLGSLGILEEAIVRIAALTGTAEVCLKNRALVVLCADNGVVRYSLVELPSGSRKSWCWSLSAKVRSLSSIDGQ